MKAPLSAGRLAVALLSLSSAASALSWPRWLPELDALVVRQAGSSSSSDSPSATPTPSPSGSGSNVPPSTTSSGLQTMQTNLNTGGITKSGSSATGSGKASGSSTRTTAPKKTTFNPQDPAGGVVMVTPAPTDGFQLYKIKDFVTWKWNYTNLQATPTGIDLFVKCSRVPQPWTLTANMSFASVGTYTWDTGAFQESNVATPLLTDMYTLVIADVDGGISATPVAGYLAPYSGLTFGLYTPQQYQNNSDGWQCASCSGAMSGLDNRAVGLAAVTSVLTVLSFTWFVAGFGALL